MLQQYLADLAVAQYAANLCGTGTCSTLQARRHGRLYSGKNLQAICHVVNEAHTQTGLQNSIEEKSGMLEELYETTHAGTALELKRLQSILKELRNVVHWKSHRHSVPTSPV